VWYIIEFFSPKNLSSISLIIFGERVVTPEQDLQCALRAINPYSSTNFPERLEPEKKPVPVPYPHYFLAFPATI
jgi:hypothetical protein